MEYTAYFCEAAGQWFVSSHRLALGRHAGGGRYYPSLEHLAEGCKAFAALPVLLSVRPLPYHS